MRTLFQIVFLLLFPYSLFAQLSPGDLTKAHQHLEGLSNCTKCHEIGEKVTNQKCLACHTEMDVMIRLEKGFHASADVKEKDCFVCHSEHHGRNFQITRFDEKAFDHGKAGYVLEGKHARIDCRDCHQPEKIQTKLSQKKEGTFLGLGTACLSCHDDYHQQTLGTECTACHGMESFKPAIHFNHQKTKYPLTGKHQQVDCSNCHQAAQQNGKEFRQYAGLDFANCNSCHKDVHDNKFGQDCKRCHSVESFHQLSSVKEFDHNKTGFALKGKHQSVDCRKCHRGSYTKQLAHSNCTDCHADYHRGQLAENCKVADCDECHQVEGFSPSFYTVERHNQTQFKLEEAHMATPCFACHKKENDRWEFRKIGNNCIDCHENIHVGFITEKYLPQNRCESCHSVSTWAKVEFDHNQTKFELQGRHAQIDCRKCHFIKTDGDHIVQQFANRSMQCESCHLDAHRGQFEENLQVLCNRCHGFKSWDITQFDHSKARFSLDGAHVNVKCGKCHQPIEDQNGTYVKYKLFKQIKCANCHS